MSWLFDRICELAVADCIEIVIAADTWEPVPVDGSVDLVEVLVRASHIPQLTISVLPSARRGRPFSEFTTEEVDLDLLPEGDAVASVRHLLDVQRSYEGALMVLRGGIASIHQVGSAHRPMASLTGGGGSTRSDTCRCIFATDRPEDAARFELLAERDLGIAIGGAHPQAKVNVDDVLGVVSIIDALVTLRYVAFGVGSVN